MKVYRVWISYDLGFNDATERLSDAVKDQKYKERYAAFMPWLKAQKAKECGNSVAFMTYKVDDAVKPADALKKEIFEVFKHANVKDVEGIRMYTIIAEPSALGSGTLAKELQSGFLVGGRHDTNPWD